MDILYKLHNCPITSITLSQFRARQSDYIAAAQREPVEITSRGVGRRAVLVSPEFFDRALEALEDQVDVHAATAAREESDPRVSHTDVIAEFGL
ncbi:MAG: type II toxin-antitoxin system prevent-host-death family antitoxin [Gulosibacter sp.]|uniref:type II toxin-antitoxin system prevent-host-death family antitoxin n=1 Tax=Gulosibacter sp. TaxID=2817531 RepID=UPI003F92A08A